MTTSQRETWCVTDQLGDVVTVWRSSRHNLSVVRDGPGFHISNEFGRHLRGPKGRVRVFKTVGAAQLAADIEKGVV